MTEPYIGEIRAVGFNFAPRGWAMCNGQLLSIAQNTALFSILGTNYGGNGQTTFGLPNLQGRFPVHAGSTPGLTPHQVGEVGGVANVSLTQNEMPAHSHAPRAKAGPGDSNSPEGTVWGQAHVGRATEQVYTAGGGAVGMSPSALAPTGVGLPHNNLPPYLVVNFVIALEGIFPPRQ